MNINLKNTSMKIIGVIKSPLSSCYPTFHESCVFILQNFITPIPSWMLGSGQDTYPRNVVFLNNFISIIE